METDHYEMTKFTSRHTNNSVGDWPLRNDTVYKIDTQTTQMETDLYKLKLQIETETTRMETDHYEMTKFPIRHTNDSVGEWRLPFTK